LEDVKAIDSAKSNLAQTYVNAFVNAGFKVDSLMADKKNPWVVKVKAEGVTSAVAGLGMTHIWNSASGSNEISEYLELSDIYSKGGACLGVGVCCTGLVDESDPALALLSDHINDKE
jgi:26S proteasome regulatory subunit N1